MFFLIFVIRLINCDVLVSLQLPLAQIVNFANLLVSLFVVSELGTSATCKVWINRRQAVGHGDDNNMNFKTPCYPVLTVLI